MPVLPFLVLLFLLVGQLTLIWRQINDPGTRAGDEGDYYHRAMYLVRNRSFAPATDFDKKILEGKAFGYGNIRPPGYPVFLAMMANDEPSIFQLRRRAALIQFAMAGLNIICLYVASWLFLRNSKWLYLVALVIGSQPWTFEFSGLLITESLTMSFATFGILGLAFLSVPTRT